MRFSFNEQSMRIFKTQGNVVTKTAAGIIQADLSFKPLMINIDHQRDSPNIVASRT